MGIGDSGYTINGVRYLVSARFEKFIPNNYGKTVTSILEKYINSDFADLNIESDGDTITNDVMNTTAGKED